jgi:hypothetical protein
MDTFGVVAQKDIWEKMKTSKGNFLRDFFSQSRFCEFVRIWENG